MQVKEGSRAPRNSMKALSKGGQLGESNRKGGLVERSQGQTLQAFQLKKCAPFSYKLAHKK